MQYSGFSVTLTTVALTRYLLDLGAVYLVMSFLAFSKLTSSIVNKDITQEIRTINVHLMAKKLNTPLPYHTPCTYCKSDIVQLETDCLQGLYMYCCLQAKLMNTPITAFFWSLCLQCKRATLLDSWLSAPPICTHKQY
jgi:hypothetical protein